MYTHAAKALPCPNVSKCGVTVMDCRRVDYTCKRLGGNICFIYSCPCCHKEYSNLRCLSAKTYKNFAKLEEPSAELSVWFQNKKGQWQLECRGRKWLRCDHCCALYMYGRGKAAKHTKDRCPKWQAENAAANDRCRKWKAENAAANDASISLNVVSSDLNNLTLSGSFVTGSTLRSTSFGLEGEAVESKTVELKSVHIKTMESKMMESKAVECKTMETKMAETKAVETGHRNRPAADKLEIRLYSQQETSTRHNNISKMLAAGYLSCDGMDPDMQKSIVEQMWASMDNDARAAMLPKLSSMAVELNRKRPSPSARAAPAAESKRHHPSGAEAAYTADEQAISGLFSC